MATEHHEKSYKITVNGVEHTVDHDVLSFDEVVALEFPNADPNTIFSVSFDHAKEPKEGELLAGRSVTVKQNTEFDVDDTGRS
jgi:Multiubiquitin